MTYTIPPATAVAGQAGFITDINNAYAALASVAGVNPLNTTYAGGADPTGASDSTSALQAALTAAAGGMLWIPPGTYSISGTLLFQGNTTIMGAGPGRSIIKVATGSGLTAAMASNGWTTSANTTSQNPVYMSGFRCDANAAATYSIVSQNFWSYFTDLYVSNATGDGLRFDAWGQNGTTEFNVGVTAVENHVTRCQFRGNTGSGLRVHDDIVNQHFTDGWADDCIFQGPGSSGTAALLQVDALAGWKVNGNHLYGAALNAMSGQRLYNTRITNNYVEPWGTIATSGGYAGMSFDGMADGGFGSSVISGNTLAVDATSPGNAASTISGIFCRVTSGNTGGLSITGNTISNPEPVAAKYKAALDLQTQNAAATMNVATTGNVAGSGWTAGVLLTANGGTINHTTGV